jgi:hypothetical protein
VFTVVVAKYGLEKLGIHLTLEQQEAYLHAWRVVGRVLGIDPRLLPETMAGVDEMARVIQQRQFAESPQGRELTAALLQAMKTMLPLPLNGVPAMMMRHFLHEDPYDGRDIASMLGVPPGKFTDLFLDAATGLGKLVNHCEEHSSLARKLIRHVGMDMIEGMLRLERGGNRPPFDIPAHLRTNWASKAAQTA